MQDHEPSPSPSWSDETWGKLRQAESIKELDAIWAQLEDAGEVDSPGGTEYRNAVKHLALEREYLAVTNERLKDVMRYLQDKCGRAGVDISDDIDRLDAVITDYALAWATFMP